MAKTTLSTSAELLELLQKSNLLDKPSLAKAVVEAEPDPAVAARQMVEKGLITAWQADQLLAGQFVLRLGDSKFSLLDEPDTWEFGRTFLAENGPTGERVTLKLISSRLMSSKQLQKDLVADLTKLVKVKHGGLVNFREVGRAGPRLFVVSERVEHPSVAKCREAGVALGNAAAVRLLERAAGSLAELHQRDLPHGCLSPAKIVVAAEGQVQLLDCGLRALVPTVLEDPNFTSEFAAYRPTKDAGTARGDLYALGRIVDEARRVATESPSTTTCAPTWWTETTSAEGADTDLTQMLARLSGEEGEPLAEAKALVAACRQWREKHLGEAQPLEATAASAAAPSGAEAAAKATTSTESAAPAQEGALQITIDTERRRKRPVEKDAGESVPRPAGQRNSRLLLLCSAATVVIVILLSVAYATKDRWAKKTEVADAASPTRTVSRTVTAEEDLTLPDADAPLPEPPPDPVTKSLIDQPSPLANMQSAVVAANDAPAGTTAPANPAAPAAETAQPAAAPDPGATAAATEPTSNVPPSETVAAKVPDPDPNAPAPASTPAATSPTPPSNYLAQFPAAVSLPSLDAGTGKTTTLAPVAIDDMIPCYLELLGGDRVVKGSEKLTLENAQGGTAPRQWDAFVVSGPGSRTAVGQFTLLGGQLTFQWLDAATSVNLAGMLENCFLKVTVGAEAKTVGLRQTIRVPAPVLDLDKGLIAAKFEIPNGPDPSACRVEILALDGQFPPHTLQPKGSMPADDGKQWILLGDNPAQRVLVLHVESSLRRQLLLNINCLMPWGEEPNELWLRDRTRKTTKATRTQLANAVAATYVQTKARLDSFAGVDESKLPKGEKEKFSQQKNLAKVDFEKADGARKKMEQLEQLVTALNDQGKIQFRLIFEAEGRSIELLRTE